MDKSKVYTRTMLAKELSALLNMPKGQTKILLEIVFRLIISALINYDTIILRPLGKLRVAEQIVIINKKYKDTTPDRKRIRRVYFLPSKSVKQIIQKEEYE